MFKGNLIPKKAGQVMFKGNVIPKKAGRIRFFGLGAGNGAVCRRFCILTKYPILLEI
jgi:hypothetical protein